VGCGVWGVGCGGNFFLRFPSIAQGRFIFPRKIAEGAEEAEEAEGEEGNFSESKGLFNRKKPGSGLPPTVFIVAPDHF